GSSVEPRSSGRRAPRRFSNPRTTSTPAVSRNSTKTSALPERRGEATSNQRIQQSVMKDHPLRTSVIGSYPFPGWLEFACGHLDQFGAADRAELIDDAVCIALRDQ